MERKHRRGSPNRQDRTKKKISRQSINPKMKPHNYWSIMQNVCVDGDSQKKSLKLQKEVLLLK